jgi:hypothetical protein
MFAGAKAAPDTVEDDFLGGGGVQDTDIYPAEIKTAYMQKAQNSGAMSLVLLMNVNGKDFRSQTWMTNKQGEVTFKDKKTGEIKNLPGFVQMNALAMILTGKEIGDLDVEEKVVKLYDFESKKEVPQSVDCYTELHGLKLQVALQRQIVDVTKKVEGTNDYEPTGEVKDINEIIKFFPEDKRVTISEVNQYISSLGSSLTDTIASGHLLKAINKMPEDMGNYAKTWLDRNKGETYNKAKGKKGGGGKEFGGGTANKEASDAAQSKANDLFD